MRPLLDQQRRGSLSPTHQRGVPRRSSLEKKVLRGLRRASFEASSGGGPRLQRSTSGLAFDESDKENWAPK